MPKKRGLNKQRNRLSREARQRIYAAALEHPELGARRLSRALRNEGIEASEGAVRAALQKLNLQTKDLRLKLLEKRLLTENISLSEEQQRALYRFNPCLRERPMEVFQSAARPAVEAKPEPKPSDAAAAASPALTLADLPPPPSGERPEWRPEWAAWAFRALNAGLVCLIAYFGWNVGVHLTGIGEQRPEPAAVQELQPAAPIPGPADARKPLPPEEYQTIWDRNLFGVPAAAKPPSRSEKAAVEKIALAGRNVGLRLIGTVAADDPKRSYAVIDVVATRDQGIFRERDRVGKVVIKSILRNTVIIETESGERRRLSTDEDLPQDQLAQPSGPAPPGRNTADGSRFQVSRADVAAALSDIPRVADEAFRPVPGGEGIANGFSLGRLRGADFFYRIGMRTGDVVKGVDGQEFKGPEDAELFLQRLAQGGRVSVLIERRGKPSNLEVFIE